VCRRPSRRSVTLVDCNYNASLDALDRSRRSRSEPFLLIRARGEIHHACDRSRVDPSSSVSPSRPARPSVVFETTDGRASAAPSTRVDGPRFDVSRTFREHRAHDAHRADWDQHARDAIDAASLQVHESLLGLKKLSDRVATPRASRQSFGRARARRPRCVVVRVARASSARASSRAVEP